MASDNSYVKFVVDQIENADLITYRQMFGEYGIYADGLLFGLICDNQLFIKPTENGRVYIRDVVEASPYPGAKPSFLIGDKIENREWLSGLVRITVKELLETQLQKSRKNKKLKK